MNTPSRFSAPSQTPSIRSMVEADLDAVHRIELAASPDPWSAALFADELTGDGGHRHWLVAVVDRRPVGFGGLLFIADEAHIMNVAVQPDHRRRGIAAMLVARLLLEAGDRGATGATLEVRASNHAALALYGRFGFEQAGRRPRYYPNGEDAVVMWAHRIYRADYRARLMASVGTDD